MISCRGRDALSQKMHAKLHHVHCLPRFLESVLSSVHSSHPISTLSRRQSRLVMYYQKTKGAARTQAGVGTNPNESQEWGSNPKLGLAKSTAELPLKSTQAGLRRVVLLCPRPGVLAM